MTTHIPDPQFPLRDILLPSELSFVRYACNPPVQLPHTPEVVTFWSFDPRTEQYYVRTLWRGLSAKVAIDMGLTTYSREDASYFVWRLIAQSFLVYIRDTVFGGKNAK